MSRDGLQLRLLGFQAAAAASAAAERSGFHVKLFTFTAASCSESCCTQMPMTHAAFPTITSPSFSKPPFLPLYFAQPLLVDAMKGDGRAGRVLMALVALQL